MSKNNFLTTWISTNCGTTTSTPTENISVQQVTDAIYQASDDRDIAASLAVDESSAFDSLEHDILLRKIKL